jgi:class 3 adenylate cyclase/predicted ATPase
MHDLRDWLAGLGLERYAEVFNVNAIDSGILPALTERDLQALGIPLGHRKRLLKAIAALAGTAAPPVSTASAPAGHEAERRQVTVMFCDLVGSTALSQRLDPEDMREVIAAYRGACAKAVARFDGFIAKYMGDGVLVYFGYPRAHEDDAERAVKAGLVIVDAVAGLRPDIDLKVRIGIATGLVVAGDLVSEGAAEESAIVGATPNLAARLQGIASPGTVVIAPSTRRLVDAMFEYEDLGMHALKGIAEPVAVSRVAAERVTQSRFEAVHAGRLTTFVGRDSEIALLLHRWGRVKEGDGQVVLLAGEAGIGKSRVTQALREQVSPEPHTHLRYQCSPYHTSSALYPSIGQLEFAAGFAPGDSPKMKLDKLERLIGHAPDSDAEAVPLLAALLSIPIEGRYRPLDLSPSERKQRTLEALLRLLFGLARRRPVLFILEDAHWIDPTTQELIGLAIDRMQRTPVLLVVTHRPEYTSPWGHHRHVSMLMLDRLGRPQCNAMIDGLTSGKALPHEVLDQIIAKTDGVPLFVEELTKMVLDSGLLAEAPDRYTLSATLPPLAIPSTLQDSLMARLDRMAPVKEVAQIGAAIGREFSYDLLAAVSPLQGNELAHALAQLEAAELIFGRGTPPCATYTFKHALVQDTAYATLLRGKRQQLHARIAETLTRLFPERAAVEPEMLAHHYTAAGQIGQAVEYWKRAGIHAVERSANLEALAHLSKGLDLLESLPETIERNRQEVALRMPLGIAYMSSRGLHVPEVRAVYARVRVLCEALADASGLFTATWHLWMTDKDWETADARSKELLILAERERDSGMILQANHAAWTLNFQKGALEATRRHSDIGIQVYSLEQHRSHAFRYGGHDPGVCCRSTGGHVRWLLGFPDQAELLVRDSLAVAEARAHPMSTTHALGFGAAHFQFRREPDKVRDLAEKAAPIARDHGLLSVVWAVVGRVAGLWAETMEEPTPSRVALIREELESMRAEYYRSYCLGLLAECYGRIGAAAEGLLTVTEALAQAENSMRWWKAELHRLKGELLLSQSRQNVSEAERCFEQAVAIARGQSAKSLELRAAISLARLWRDQGRRTGASEQLIPIYGWFTEGFDTPDLKEAKELLDELGK